MHLFPAGQCLPIALFCMGVSLGLRNFAGQFFFFFKAFICMLMFLYFADKLSLLVVTVPVVLMFLLLANLHPGYRIAGLIVLMPRRFVKPADQLFCIAVICMLMLFYSTERSCFHCNRRKHQSICGYEHHNSRSDADRPG